MIEVQILCILHMYYYSCRTQLDSFYTGLPNMTILTGAACGFIMKTSGGLVPAAVGSAAGVVLTGVKIWVQSEPVKVALATAVGVGTSAGAITNVAYEKNAKSAATGAIVGGLSAAGVGAALAGGLAMGGTLSANPLSLLTVGTSVSEHGTEATFDCWKPVVHDTSEETSSGMTLDELMAHPNVSDVVVTHETCLPKVAIENIWDEKFELEYVVSSDFGKLYLHAVRVN